MRKSNFSFTFDHWPAAFRTRPIDVVIQKACEGKNQKSSYSLLSPRSAQNLKKKIYELTSSLSSLRAKPTTIIPCLTSCLQVSAPIPDEAPVTTATLPFQFSMTNFFPKNKRVRAGWSTVSEKRKTLARLACQTLSENRIKSSI